MSSASDFAAGHNLAHQGDAHAWAVTSPDDRFRYLLGRSWGHGPTWVFCCLNPSKARHDIADPTLRKICGFAKRGGAGGFVICNLFAYSATDPKDMVAYLVGASQVDLSFAIGDRNTAAMRWAIGRARDPRLTTPGRVLSAWGKVPPKARSYASLSRLIWVALARTPTDCLGTNGDGSPCHPIMLAYATPIVPWKPREKSAEAAP